MSPAHSVSLGSTLGTAYCLGDPGARGQCCFHPRWGFAQASLLLRYKYGQAGGDTGVEAKLQGSFYVHRSKTDVTTYDMGLYETGLGGVHNVVGCYRDTPRVNECKE